MQKRILAAALASLSAGSGFADTHQMEEVTIVGSVEDARTLAGSGSVIDHEQLLIDSTGDIIQLMQTLPGCPAALAVAQLARKIEETVISGG